MLGSGRPGRRGDDGQQGEDPGEHLRAGEPAVPGRPGHRRPLAERGAIYIGGDHRRGAAYRLGVTAAVLATLAILAGAAGLAFTSRSTDSRHTASGHRSNRELGQVTISDAPIRVRSVTPAGPVKVSGTTSVQVAFSVAVAEYSPAPRISPHVAGQWQASGSTLTFTPDVPLPPSTRYTVRVPAGDAGVRSVAGRVLAKPVTAHFRTAAYSQLRLAQLLSTLGYLPLTWRPDAGDRMTSDPAAGQVASQQEMAYSPPAGSFTWQHGYPAALHAQWRTGQPNPLVQGAVMAFKAQHHLAVTATVSRRFWNKLFAAARAGQRNAVGYTYAIASKGSPETLTIWHDGHLVLHSLANTGIPVAPTVSGTFPVYLRYRFQITRGTNPDGSHYADPVAYVAYFNGGDAVHYFPRGSYGFEQSLGCVELPYDAARQAWPFLTYGSLVTVTG